MISDWLAGLETDVASSCIGGDSAPAASHGGALEGVLRLTSCRRQRRRSSFAAAAAAIAAVAAATAKIASDTDEDGDALDFGAGALEGRAECDVEEDWAWPETESGGDSSESGGGLPSTEVGPSWSGLQFLME
jgi:hypothetical protein